jgi:hypothetical protein
LIALATDNKVQFEYLWEEHYYLWGMLNLEPILRLAIDRKSSDGI